MSKVKFYQVEKEINGTKYTAQFSGMRAWMRLSDESKNGDTVSTEKLIDKVLSVGLIEPRVTMDDFETQDELMDVFNFVSEVMKGNFRDKEKQEATKAAGN